GRAGRRGARLRRAHHDAIVIGPGAAAADDPELTCRLPGLSDRSPVRVVMDSRRRLPPSAKLLATARATPTWVLTATGGAQEHGQGPEQDVEIIAVDADDRGRLSLRTALQRLAGPGITRLLVEGGSSLVASFLRADLVDRVYWFRAASVIGGDGLPAVAAPGVARLADAARFQRTDVVPLGDDILETYRRVP